MTKNENELLNIIHQHSNPEQALKIAMDLMVDFLKMHEAPQDTFSVHHQEAS